MSGQFFGREKELNRMQQLFERSPNRCLAIYGRRRIGKTRLITEFCRGKNTLSFMGRRGTSSDNLEMMIYRLKEYGYEGILNCYLDVFKALRIIAQKQQTVIVIDEFPEFCKDNPSFQSDVQEFIDQSLSKTNSFLIICGSSISSMYDIINDQKEPLFGRFSNNMRVEPLSYRECRKIKPNMSDEDFMALFCTIGGVPLYYSMVYDDNYIDCLKNSLLSAGSGFFTEPFDVVLREFSSTPPIDSILDKIGTGITEMKKLSEAAHMSQPLCSIHITTLEKMGMVEKRNPMLGTNKKTKMLKISDRFIDWNYSIIYPNDLIIQTSDPDTAYEILEPKIYTYLGKAFESVCMQYVKENYVCRAIGSWWGRFNDTDTDIDIVAEIVEDGTNKVLVGECKYRNRKTDSDVLMELMERSTVLKTSETKVYVIFSKSGFTEDMIEAAEVYGARLVTLKDFN